MKQSKLNMHNNLDTNSIGGTFFTLTTFILSYFQLEQASRLGLMLISGAVGITTIIYNIKKIKKIDKDEKP